MEKRELQILAGLTEAKWIDSAKTKVTPPEGLFASAPVAKVVKWLKANHADFASAMASLNFYINRAGKNLPAERKAELNGAKDKLRSAFKVSESVSTSFLAFHAGIRPFIKEEEEKKPDDEEPKDEPKDTDDKGTGDENKDEHLEELLLKVAKKAEGKSAEDMVDMIRQIYQAGFEDGKVAKDSEEEKTEEPTEDTEETTEDDKEKKVEENRKFWK